MRCDVNVSVNRAGEPPGTRCEIKNLNSVRFMVAAISTFHFAFIHFLLATRSPSPFNHLYLATLLRRLLTFTNTGSYQSTRYPANAPS